mmetsp:Transcript_15230/g.39247  ORF Transcript_15230/g.39247 Transcript_15230/m.39247 type:complete len:268 (-) Transcript_15230:117-920(-)
MPSSTRLMSSPCRSWRCFQNTSLLCSMTLAPAHHFSSSSKPRRHLWKYQSQTARVATTDTAPTSFETYASEASSLSCCFTSLVGLANLSSTFWLGSQTAARCLFSAATFLVSCMPSATMPCARSSFSVLRIFFASFSSSARASATTPSAVLPQASSRLCSAGLLHLLSEPLAASPSSSSGRMVPTFCHIFSTSGPRRRLWTRSRTVCRRPPSPLDLKSASSVENHFFHEASFAKRKVSVVSSKRSSSSRQSVSTSLSTFSSSSKRAL